ncbi:hypothetical protein O0I10_011535 [Lichtheimia ornata]|uniref:F-box domain-containing protein n=1 Tax=Lichtheimia ornata TaxID=688661 RepID=A0AAD7UV47_9FUNG|nr:uncharacterized protein O0I10_011535 [Lichtheimia ornata]KAJ8652796.1 hypothetical protein O0I10_011535 [Lichtheimia ornata]
MIQTDIDILCPAQSAVANDNHFIDEEIKELTTHVQDCVQKLLSTLNARASLLRNAERLVLALDDAHAMMNIAPHSPLGYLCAGDIDSLRGHYASAIKLYDDGLERSPKSHPQYQQLVKARAAAYDKQNKRIDFISQLPLDVVVLNIIPRILQAQTVFDIGKPCPYFDVCRTWRQRVALVDGFDYEVGPGDLSEDGYGRVRDLAPFMRSFTVAQARREILSKIIRPPNNRLFNMLKKLTIIESITRGPSLLLSSLRSLSYTLTDLDIEYGHRLTPKKRYRLRDVMEGCPHLVSLRMCRGNVDMSSVTKTYPKLIKLELQNVSSNVYDGDMASVLHPFPQLRVLKLLPVSSSGLFPAIDSCCPVLQQLILSWQSSDFADLMDIPERPGLRALSMSNMLGFGNFAENDMLEYLIKHSDTMEVLDIPYEYAFKTPKDLLQQEASRQVTFKQLRRISYPFDAKEGLVPFILWIIQCAPHLESIGTVAGPQQAPIMQELIRPRHANLMQLGIRATRSILDDEERLIQHHLDLGEHSNMRELKIYFPEHFAHHAWLPLIPQLTQLTTLELSTDVQQGFLSLESFMSKLADGCPSLEQLTMTHDGQSMNMNTVDPMYRHNNLKRIVIDCRAIHGDVTLFCGHFTNLESLHLKLMKYDWEDIERLQRGSFRLTFTLKRVRIPAFLYHAIIR